MRSLLPTFLVLVLFGCESTAGSPPIAEEDQKLIDWIDASLEKTPTTPDHQKRQLMDVRATLAGEETNQPRKGMEGMGWFIGRWTGKGEMPPFGKYEDGYTYSWVGSKRRFVRAEYRLMVDGEVKVTNIVMIGWDEKRKRLYTFAFGMDGSIGWAEETEAEGDSAFVWEGGPDPRFQIRIRKIDDDSFSIVLAMFTDGKFVPTPPMVYTRSR